jgi:hypothetical protein
VQYHRIGTRGQLADRSFRYYRLTNATGVVAYNLAQNPVAIANYVTQNGGLGAIPGTDTGGVPAGSRVIRANMGATAGHDNQYEDGYIKIESGTGLGQMYKIKKHIAIDSSGAGNIATFELYDDVRTTIATAAVFSLVPNPWADVLIYPGTTATGMAVGVPNHAIPAATTTAPTYGWIQTWGLCSVLNQSGAGGCVVASGVIPTGAATVGAVDVAGETEIKQRIGIAYQTLATDAVYINVFLQIAP